MQGRADFVADVGQKAAFGFGGGVGGFHGLPQFRVQPLQVLGSGALFKFRRQTLSPFFHLAAKLEVPEEDEQEDKKPAFDPEQAYPERARRQMQRGVAPEPAVGEQFPGWRLDLVERLGQDAVQFGPVRAHAKREPVLGGNGGRGVELEVRIALQARKDAGGVVHQCVGMPGHHPEEPLKRVGHRIESDVGIMAFQIVMPEMPVDYGNALAGEFPEAGGVLAVFVDDDDARQGDVGLGQQQIGVRGQRGLDHGENVGPPLLGVFKGHCPVGQRFDPELETDDARQQPQIVKAQPGIGVDLLGIGGGDKGRAHADGQDGMLFNPCLLLRREELGQGRHGRQHADGGFEGGQIAVIRGILGHQQDMHGKEDENDEDGSDENKDAHGDARARRIQGSVVWQTCSLRSRAAVRTVLCLSVAGKSSDVWLGSCRSVAPAAVAGRDWGDGLSKESLSKPSTLAKGAQKGQ